MTRDRWALYGAAVLAAMLVGPHGLLYWDSFGYVIQAITGHTGGLMLGRPLFVLISHLVALAWRAAGNSVWTLEPALRFFWLLVSASLAPAAYSMARAGGLQRQGALMAGLAAAWSPAIANTSDAVLTDAPSTALAAWALFAGVRAVRAERPVAWSFTAGILLGIAFGLREQAITGALSLALLVLAAPRQHRLAMAASMTTGTLLAGALPVLWATVTQPGYWHGVRAWVRAMQRERAVNSHGIRDVAMYGLWLITLGPLPLWWAARAWIRERESLWKWGGIFTAVCVPSLLQLGALSGYQDIAFSPRYILPTWVGAVCIPAGVWWESRAGVGRSWKAGVAGILVTLALVGGAMRWKQRELRGLLDGVRAQMASVPTGSVVVTGQLCPAIELVERLGREAQGTTAPRWQRVCPGWSWPDDLAGRLDRARSEGRTVVLDLRKGAWPGAGQQASLAEVRAYAARHAGGDTPAGGAGEVVVWR